jgi:hypothetical protein
MFDIKMRERESYFAWIKNNKSINTTFGHVFSTLTRSCN